MLTTNYINRERIYLFGLILLAVGIPVSHIIMSIAQIILLANWLFDKNLITHLKNFYKNKAALFFSLIFIIHLIALIYTSDFDYALKDLRTKIPLIFLPILLSSYKPLSFNSIKTILFWYVMSVSFASLVCFYVYISKQINDIREISVFISHIRFSLNICMAISILFYFIFINKILKKRIYINIALFLMIWLILFIFILQSLTGILILIILLITYGLYQIFISVKLKRKIILSFTMLIALFGFIYLIYSYYHDYFTVKESNFYNLEKTTKKGNLYEHNFTNYGIENGNYIGLYVCSKELAEEWAKRSKINYDSTDARKQEIKITLLRFLNSKGLRKDADGVNALSEKEIKAIEKGIANYLYMNDFSVKSRIYMILFEFNNYAISGSTKGYSLIQRFELWKAAIGIIKQNFWIGVGTGDMVDAYHNQLIAMNSDLQNQKIRSHNQYLSIFSAFGLIGFVIFLFSYIYPAIISKSFHKFLFVSFFIIASFSMINEDTIETQAGVSFFAFFYMLFLVFNTKENQIS